MSTKDSRLVVARCLLSGIVLWILGCNIMPVIKATPVPDPNSLPVRSMDIVMDLDQRGEFFTQLQDFADKHSLELSSTFHDAYKKSFITVLAGDGFHISVLSHLYSPRKIDVFFYNEAFPPTSPETFDVLYNDLKSFLKEVPNILIWEKLQGLRIVMDENQRDELFNEFFAQLQDFADQNSLKFTVFSFDSDMKLFLVEMDSEGFQITSEAIMSGVGKMDVDFYIHYADNGEPTSTTQATVDELFESLKNHFGKLSNVTIEDMK